MTKTLTCSLAIEAVSQEYFARSFESSAAVGICIRSAFFLAWDLTLQRRLAYWAYRRLKHRKAFHSTRSWCSQYSLRRACRSSTQQTTSSCWVHMDGRL